MSLYPKMRERPENFRLNTDCWLSRGSVFAGLGQFGGSKSTLYKDSSLYQNEGTLTGMDPPTDWVWEATLGRWVTDYDGINDYVLCPNTNLLRPTLASTAAVWCLGQSPNASNYSLMGTLGSSGNRGWAMGVNNAADLNATIAVNATTQFQVPVNDIHVSTIWTHYAMVFVPSVGLYVYQNGVLKGSNTTAPPASQYQSTLAMRIGDRGDGSAKFLGSIADPMLWNDRALCQSEISALADPSNIDLRVGGIPLIEPLWRRVYQAAAVASTAYEKTISDGMGLADSQSRASAFARSVSDSLGTSDSLSRAAGFGRLFAESLGLTDANLRSSGFAQFFADSVGLTDPRQSNKFKAYFQALSDGVGVSDFIGRTAGLARMVTDALGLTDDGLRVYQASRALSDSAGLRDDFARVVNFLRTLRETEGLSDSILRILEFARRLSGAEGLTDEVASQLSGSALSAAVLFLLLQNANQR
jgi:hypothetical protein